MVKAIEAKEHLRILEKAQSSGLFPSMEDMNGQKDMIEKDIHAAFESHEFDQMQKLQAQLVDIDKKITMEKKAMADQRQQEQNEQADGEECTFSDTTCFSAATDTFHSHQIRIFHNHHN